jgi:hypothetical protein
MKHLVTIVFCWLLASGGTSGTDDEVAVLVTRIESSSSSVRISTTHRQSAAQHRVPARNSNARKHPFLYKKDYKHWLGLKTGPSNSFFGG